MEIVWNIKHLYKTREEWNDDTLKLENKIASLEDLDILTDEETLTSFLRNLSDCYELVEKVYLYPKRILDLQNDDEQAKEMMNKAITLYNAYLKIENFYKKILVDKKEYVNELIDEKHYWYRYLYIILRKGNHIADDAILTSYNETVPRIKNNYQTLLNDEIKFESVLIDGENVEVTKKNYSHLLEDESGEHRQKFFASYMNGYKTCAEDITKLYVEKLNNDISLYRSEGYNSLIEKKLFELELNPDTLENLIQGVNEHLDIMHNLVALRKEISGLDEFHTYDSYASSTSVTPRKLEFEESVQIIKEALKPLGSKYASIIDKMLKEGWIDVYPKDHKRTIPSTSISYNGVPYILLNYTKNLNGARTTAHEMGHSIHTYFSKISNKIEYFEFDLFLTEIVSKVNEILFNEYLLNSTTDEEEKKEILNNIISSLSNSLFNQTMTTEFEHQVIKYLEAGNEINKEYLNNLYLKCMKKYNGNSLTIDELNQYGWVLVTHLVWQESYYLYQYVIGLALGTSIALKIINDSSYVDKYMELLKSGRRMSIEEALKLVDIDINDKNYLDDALNYLNERIDDLKKLVLK